MGFGEEFLKRHRQNVKGEADHAPSPLSQALKIILL
jgi:hypothetical protein